MITNEDELRAAEDWIRYWKSTRTAAQSWIGNEQAARRIVRLRTEIDEYRRQGADQKTPAAPEDESRMTPT